MYLTIIEPLLSAKYCKCFMCIILLNSYSRYFHSPHVKDKEMVVYSG